MASFWACAGHVLRPIRSSRCIHHEEKEASVSLRVALIWAAPSTLFLTVKNNNPGTPVFTPAAIVGSVLIIVKPDGQIAEHNLKAPILSDLKAEQ